MKPKILIICDYYLPGYKSGGGMRTIVNMVERFYDNFDFWIITRDHDGKLDRETYQNVKINEWNKLHHSQVFYLSKEMIKMSKLREIIADVEPEILYFNSFFSTLTIYTLLLQKLGLVAPLRSILAPCGELSEGGLSLNKQKKKIFLAFAKLSGIHQKLIWKASSKLEEDEIIKIIGTEQKIFIAPDIVPKQILSDVDLTLKPLKKKGMARLVFLSRFMRKKNFKFLIENINEIEGDLLIDVWGPIEDLSYWDECQKIINKLPSNLKIEAKGAISNEQVAGKLLEYHFFVLPTLGENFGHVFLEALSAGCPLLISDRTPWVDLEEKKIGWEIALENPLKWREYINRIIDLDTLSYSDLSTNARRYAVEMMANPKFAQDTKIILDYALVKH